MLLAGHKFEVSQNEKWKSTPLYWKLILNKFLTYKKLWNSVTHIAFNYNFEAFNGFKIGGEHLNCLQIWTLSFSSHTTTKYQMIHYLVNKALSDLCRPKRHPHAVWFIHFYTYQPHAAFNSLDFEECGKLWYLTTGQCSDCSELQTDLPFSHISGVMYHKKISQLGDQEK